MIAAALTAVVAFGAVACADTGKGGSDSGLLVKKFSGDEYHTVYGYNGGYEGESETLDIGKYASDNDIVIGRIKEGAFEDNNTLKEIIVPATVETIDAGAFKQMKKLEKITLPFIGINANSDAYFGESGKEEDKATDAERVFSHVFGTEEYDGGASVTANYGSSTATYYLPATLTEVTVSPAEAYSIPMYAFSGVAQIGKVTLGDNVDAIGAFAFENCGVQKITFTDDLKNIYESAFVGATSLKDGGISFEGVTLETIGKNAFKNTKLTSLTVNVNEIGDYAFYASALQSVTLTGVAKIGAWAFADCEKLKTGNASITLKAGLTQENFEKACGPNYFGDVVPSIN